MTPGRYRELAAATPGSILLEAAQGRSLFFTHPVEVLAAYRLDELPGLFARMEQARMHGLWAVGRVSYECGGHWEPTAAPGWAARSGHAALAAFGLYREPAIFQAEASAGSGSFSDIRFALTEQTWAAQVAEVRGLIAAGDTYQVNLTGEVTAEAHGSADALFAAMMEAQPVEYGALVNLGGPLILSASPELFFRKQGRRITVRPMKGTARRGKTPEEDQARAEALAADEKNRAENLMIVDLLRNDLGRVAATGSVRVRKLFDVERFPSLLQMSSEIIAELRPEVDFYALFGALFPSGSIVGAPKVRTMQILRELEARERGVYTGAIGYIEPSGDAVFSVAIRTGVLQDGRFRMGVGAGITWDSQAEEEYRECLLKAEFLRGPELRLIETMRWEDGRCDLLPLHLERLRRSAACLGFACENLEQSVAQALRKSEGGPWRVRMTLGRSGDLAIEPPQRIEEESEPLAALLWPEPVCSSDPWLRHKTTRRALYDRAIREARAQGCADVLFLNERGEVTEGAIHSVFIRNGDRWRTPPLACGVLPGIQRAHLLYTMPELWEEVFGLQDLLDADEVWLGNAVRGLRRVRIQVRV